MKAKMIIRLILLFSSISANMLSASPQKRIVVDSHSIEKKIDCALRKISDQLPCNFIIDRVPFVVDRPGKWCVSKDLQYDGTGIAIDIIASNVSLNFKDHNLTLTDPSAIGLQIDGQQEVSVDNDKINYTIRLSPTLPTLPNSAGIFVRNSQKIALSNILVNNAVNAISLLNSSDVTISDSLLTQGVNTDLLVQQCNQISFINSSCSNDLEDFVSGGMVFSHTNNTRFFNLSLFNTDVQFATACNNGIIDQINSYIPDLNYIFGNFQIGNNSGRNIICNNFIIRNSNFNGPGKKGIVVMLKANVVAMENCTLTSTNPNPDDVDSNSLYIGANNDTNSSHNIHVSNCVISGGNVGIALTGPATIPSTGIVIENCQVNNTLAVAIRLSFLNPFTGILGAINSSVIKNCTVYGNKADGIVLVQGATSNAIIDNIICKNNGIGINVPFPVSQQNHIENNKVFSNGGIGINISAGTNTETYYNTSCNNGGLNCSGVTPSQTPNAQPFVAGSNICCAPADVSKNADVSTLISSEIKTAQDKKIPARESSIKADKLEKTPGR